MVDPDGFGKMDISFNVEEGICRNNIGMKAVHITVRHTLPGSSYIVVYRKLFIPDIGYLPGVIARTD